MFSLHKAFNNINIINIRPVSKYFVQYIVSMSGDRNSLRPKSSLSKNSVSGVLKSPATIIIEDDLLLIIIWTSPPSLSIKTLGLHVFRFWWMIAASYKKLLVAYGTLKPQKFNTCRNGTKIYNFTVWYLAVDINTYRSYTPSFSMIWY